MEIIGKTNRCSQEAVFLLNQSLTTYNTKFTNSLNAYNTKLANIGITKIEGTYNSLAVASKNSNTTAFTFNSKFKQTPFICATVQHSWADVIQCTINSCSASKAVIKVYNGSTQNVNVTVHIIAVGYI